MRTHVALILVAGWMCGALELSAVQRVAPAPARKPAVQKPLSAKAGATKKAPAKAAASRSGSRRRSYVKKNPVPHFKAFELAGWPQLESLVPQGAQEWAPPPELPKNCALCETQLLSTAYSLIGTRYRLGGTRPETGFDCSGFVKYVYQMNFPVELPTSAPQQYRVGQSVGKEELEPGDLVFFRTRRGWHVGMYVGDDSFIHAPNHRKRVQVSPLFSDAYWRRAYVGAKRLEVPAVEPGDTIASNN
ncbi:MAG: C40 family peptidase [Acidobacteria bacterium]|nr:C40 family peptidase [Acidobacteriota bacterium]